MMMAALPQVPGGVWWQRICCRGLRFGCNRVVPSQGRVLLEHDFSCLKFPWCKKAIGLKKKDLFWG